MPYRELVVRDVVILAFPPADAVFAHAARRLVTDLGVISPEALETRLRAIYPRAVVRARDPLASFGAPAWYVYRDGRFSPFVPDDARWWEAPDAARVVVDDAGAYLDASPSALELLGVTLDELRRSRSGDFSVAAYRDLVPWILALLRDTGELHSATMLQPRGREPQPVEYRFIRDGDGPGRHLSIIRPVPLEVVEPTREADAGEPATAGA